MTRVCIDCDKIVSQYKVRCLEHNANFEVRRSRQLLAKINRLHREEFGSDPNEMRLPTR